MMRALIVCLGLALGGLTAHAAPDHHPGVPEVHVSVSAPNADDAARKLHAETIARVFHDAFKSSDEATGRFGLDVSVAKLEVDTTRDGIEVSAEVHVVISDRAGKIISYVAGGAKVQVPAHGSRARNLARLEQQALEDAAGALVDKVRTQLLRAAAHRDEPAA